MRKLWPLCTASILFAFPLAVFASTGTSDAQAGIAMTHRMMMLMIQLGVLLIAARIGNMLFEKAKLPGVLGELTAGILFGPYLLGSISIPGLPQGLFPIYMEQFPVSPELYGICTLASIILLFTIGLETNLKLFLRYSGPGTVVGIGGVLISYLAGALTGVWLLPMIAPGNYTIFSPACIFLGVMSTATSVGITARTLSEKRKLDTPEGVTILAGAVIDDVLGIILLAIGLGIISARSDGGEVNWTAIGIIAIKAIGIWLGATAIGLLASRRISALLKHFHERSAIAIMAFGLALILAGLFEEARLAMIIGAYVMGLALSRTDISQVVQDYLHPVYKLLVPLFFAIMGMLVDLSTLTSPNVLAFGLIYTLIAIVAKVMGCGLPAMLFKFNLRGAARIGTGMLPRGEVALIIAGIGLAAGVLSPEIFGVGVLMTLLTTIIAPPALVVLFRNPARGIRGAEPKQDTEPLVFHLPTEDTADLLVNKLRLAFESEGFYVHLLDYKQQHYQLMKDDVSLRVLRDGSDISFDCEPAQRAFVSTAMIEVLAEFERTVAELRRPVNAGDVLKAAPAIDPLAPKQASVNNFIAALKIECLIPSLQAHTKEALIEELIDRLVDMGHLSDRAQALEDVMTRERSMSTGMQDGIAIPHARTTAVNQLTCVIGIKAEGIDFGALDENPSTIFVLTLSPAEGAAPHIQFMANVSKTLSDKNTRQALLKSQSPAEMLQILQGTPTAPSLQSRTAKLTRKTDRTATTPDHPIERYLKPELIETNLQGNDIQSALKALIDLLAENKVISAPDKILKAVTDRESQMSTSMEHGVAIPHARTDEVNQLVCAIGIHRTGLKFNESADDRTHIIILTLSPKSKPAPHIQFMSTMAHILNAKNRQKCLKAKTPKEIYKILSSAK